MSSSTENKAAWLTGPHGNPLEIKPSPSYTPGPNELLIRSRAFAMNPIDAFKQVLGKRAFSYLPMPLILGNDVAGEVVETGPGVTRFKKGDRVIALAMGMDKRGRRPDEGAFQEFVIVRERLTAKLPEGDVGPAVSYTDASVLPLAVSTAACGLFEKEQLALALPRVNAADREGTGKTVVVWGASTSVGNAAVQLAVAAGYEVLATAGPSNWERVRALGASEVFDYRSPSVVDDLVRALEGKQCVGALAIGNGSLCKCADVVSRAGGVKFVSQASIDTPPGSFPKSLLQTIPFMAQFMWLGFTAWLKLKTSGARSKFIWGSDVIDWDTDRAVFGFVEDGLAAGVFKAAPEAMVVGKGLESVQEGLDTILKGVSAKKVVVSLEE